MHLSQRLFNPLIDGIFLITTILGLGWRKKTITKSILIWDRDFKNKLSMGAYGIIWICAWIVIFILTTLVVVIMGLLVHTEFNSCLNLVNKVKFAYLSTPPLISRRKMAVIQWTMPPHNLNTVQYKIQKWWWLLCFILPFLSMGYSTRLCSFAS